MLAEFINNNNIIIFSILRYLVSENQRKCSLPDDIQLVNVLLHIIARSHTDLISLYSSSSNQKSAIEMGKKLQRNGSLWEVLTSSFTMLGELHSRSGSSFPVDIWQSTIQVSSLFGFGDFCKHDAEVEFF